MRIYIVVFLWGALQLNAQEKGEQAIAQKIKDIIIDLERCNEEYDNFARLQRKYKGH